MQDKSKKWKEVHYGIYHVDEKDKETDKMSKFVKTLVKEESTDEKSEMAK